jgi:hypothetical protein
MHAPVHDQVGQQKAPQRPWAADRPNLLSCLFKTAVGEFSVLKSNAQRWVASGTGYCSGVFGPDEP